VTAAVKAGIATALGALLLLALALLLAR